MKNKYKKFGPVLLGALGAVLSALVVFTMVSGDLQKYVKFSGVGEEIVFTFFTILIGIISLGISISCLPGRD